MLDSRVEIPEISILKILAMSKSTYKKRKKRGEELKLDTFRQILDLYASVRKMKMEHFELANVKEGANTK